MTNITTAAGTVDWFNACVERGKKEPGFTAATVVTPGLANVLLSKNPDNRSLRAAKTAQYASDMRQGRWAFNGEPIIVAKTGELNDGQNRLAAIIESNTPTKFLFVFGVDRDSRLTVDQGAARSAADYLGMEGVPNSTVVASLTRPVLAYEKSRGDNINAANQITNAEVRERADRDVHIHESASFATHHRPSTRPFAAPAIIGFCHYVLSGQHPGDAEEYMTQVCTGEGLKKNDPAYTVRDRLFNLGRNRDQKIEVILRGWNAYHSGRPLKIAKILGNFPALV